MPPDPAVAGPAATALNQTHSLPVAVAAVVERHGRADAPIESKCVTSPPTAPARPKVRHQADGASVGVVPPLAHGAAKAATRPT